MLQDAHQNNNKSIGWVTHLYESQNIEQKPRVLPHYDGGDDPKDWVNITEGSLKYKSECNDPNTSQYSEHNGC